MLRLSKILVVQGESAHQWNQQEGSIRFTELSKKGLFRRFGLPAEIDVDRVVANPDKGILDHRGKSSRPRRKRRLRWRPEPVAPKEDHYAN